MSVWDAIVGQQPVVDLLSRISQASQFAPAQDVRQHALAQSWLICGPPGSGRSNVARAFAAAMESPDHGLESQPTKVTQQVLAGTHPDVTILATDKVTIGIDQVRDLIATSEQMPSTAPWRIIIIEDVDRMMERTTNVLLKEIEEPAEHTIWLLCAPSPQDVLPTIRSRTRIVNLAVPPTAAVAEFLKQHTDADPHVSARAARLAEGHIGIARLYATNERVMADRDSLVVGVLNMSRTSDAVMLAEGLIASAREQAQDDITAQIEAEQRSFRNINGLDHNERMPSNLRSAYHAISAKDDVRRRVTRRSRDVLDRALNSIASVYRDVCVLQNNAEDAVGIINLENRTAITELSVRLNRAQAIARLEHIATARRRMAGNVAPQLVFEALFSALVV
ncbi:MAG: DNA polymerase III subunit delta' [Bifidobacterium sp.]|jgi:DNA polymerase-3 subunit delta'|nr:DNA polymerase III subunit delta' [Bifidobacterium sp.]MCH4174797.1 DNA polymerase III subunit delta' [Bifidobacterium sp.]